MIDTLYVNIDNNLFVLYRTYIVHLVSNNYNTRPVWTEEEDKVLGRERNHSIRKRVNDLAINDA